MCDIVKERKRINAILAWAMSQPPVIDSVDEAKLAGYGLAVLRRSYSDACPDECLRQKCAEYATFVANLRRSRSDRTPIISVDLAGGMFLSLHFVRDPWTVRSAVLPSAPSLDV
jgi:hypothetical protein